MKKNKILGNKNLILSLSLGNLLAQYKKKNQGTDHNILQHYLHEFQLKTEVYHMEN